MRRRRPAGSPPPSPFKWHIVTSEYPPQPGGVSDYTLQVAKGLSMAGDEVHVWCPSVPYAPPESPGVNVHRDLGRITMADLRRVGRQLCRFPAPRRLLVQWVPHGYRYWSMNLPFCIWLWNRARRHGDRVDIMVHEPFLAFREGSWRQDAAALVHRVMAAILLLSAHQVWISIPAWEQCLRPYALSRRVTFQWLAVPSNIPVADDPQGISMIRAKYASQGQVLVGHFGTYSSSITSLLVPLLHALLVCFRDQTVLLMGRGSEGFRGEFVRSNPSLAPHVHAVDSLAAVDVSRHIAACDLLVQPYPDGVSSRRTSCMVGLCHGKPVVTTTGRLTEGFWAGSGCVAMAPAGDTDALVSLVQVLRDSEDKRRRMGTAAKKLYDDHFDVRHVITALRQKHPESSRPDDVGLCASQLSIGPGAR